MRSTIVMLGVAAALVASGCGAAASSLRQELGPTPQEQLVSERAQCKAEREHEDEIRLDLRRQVSEITYELGTVRSALAASEQRRVDAEGALVTLRNETAKKGDRGRR